MEAENWLKEQFRATTLLEGQERLRSFINLELHIIKLREMGSHLSLRLTKEGNIEGEALIIHCVVLFCFCMVSSFVFNS
jgi:hypothetical protein